MIGTPTGAMVIAAGINRTIMLAAIARTVVIVSGLLRTALIAIAVSGAMV